MISLNTSLEGLQRAETGFNRAAARIAAPADTSPTDIVDLLQARHDFEANLKAIKIDDEMTRSTLDLLA